MNSWNGTNAIHDCTPDSFEGVDPLPGQEKSCHCDPYSMYNGYINYFKEYWRQIYAEKQAAEQLARDEAEAKAAKE